MSSSSFSALGLNPALLENLTSLNYHQMTPVQAEALPPVLAGRDLIAQAKTGSGKTAAFGLGLLQQIEPRVFAVQSLVLCPTRELADQVAGELRKLARLLPNIKVLTLCGGAPIGPQIGSLEHGAHIVVGTPGRVDDHLRKGTLRLPRVTTLVLDEADRMLDMGFQEVLERIVQQLPNSRQTLLFSATFPAGIRAISAAVLTDPVTVTITEQHSQSSIEQQFIDIGASERDRACARLLLHYRPDSALIFCNTKQEARDLSQALGRYGLTLAALHGDLEQKDRDQTLVRFANKSLSVLVATDVAARGLDIDSVELVINYQIARDLAVHTHRVGRTGRAGQSGRAITLFTQRERHKLERLAELTEQSVEAQSLPPEQLLQQPGYRPPMVTLQIDGGKKQKLRPGDILGALTATGGLQADEVGKIQLQDQRAYVAVTRAQGKVALDLINGGKLKGRNFRARSL